MKIQFISTVVGPLGPDVLGRLASLSRECGAEWLSSKLIRLDGQFAAIFKVSIEDSAEAMLRERLAQAFPELGFVYAPVQQAVQERHESVAGVAPDVVTVQLALDCNDRPGLTRDINETLANLGVSVTQLESHRMQVASLGRTVFNANLTLVLPPQLDVASLSAALEAVEPNARVHPQ